MKSDDARTFAATAHSSINQNRKYSGEPYIVHPEAVVMILKMAGEKDEDVLSAAYLHDVLEDVWPVTKLDYPHMIEDQFGTNVLAMVQELTDEYITTKYPTLNRAKRKALEANRLGKISIGAMKVKLAGLIHNTADIVKNDPGFAVKYLQEKERILAEMALIAQHTVDPVFKALYERALHALHTSQSILS